MLYRIEDEEDHATEDFGKTLAEEKDLIRQWVLSGAEYGSLVFVAPSKGTVAQINPVDHFIGKILKTRATILRRRQIGQPWPAVHL